MTRRFIHPALLGTVFIIATSGLVYQLIAGTLASYVLGDSVTQFSFIIGLYLFAMGIGSYLSKFIEDNVLVRFIEIELGLAIAGGFSAPLLFKVYASWGAFQAVLYGLISIVGILVGLEIPLLLRLLKSDLDLKDLVARVLTVDYIGALVGSVLFPSVLLPRFGIHQTSLAFGILNAVAGFGGTFLLPLERATAFRLRVSALIVVAALGLGMATMETLVKTAETFYFGAPIVHASQSPYQRVVLTQSPRTTRLFLNGNLQFSSDDEYRYHEVLVHPAVGALGRDPRRVLILGGGDGLGAREIFRYPSVEQVVLVDLDPHVTELFSTLPVARELNHDALNDPRLTVVNTDAYQYLEQAQEAFDLIVVDFPDPSNYGVGKLYTVSFYRLLQERLGMRGVTVVQSTSPHYARRTFWGIVATMEEAGLTTAPMHVYVPSFGEWGFVMAGGEGFQAPTALRIESAELKYLEPSLLEGLFTFPRDWERIEAPIHRLNDQRLVPIYTEEWSSWAR